MADIKESPQVEEPQEAKDPQAAEESKPEEKPFEAPQEPQKDSSSQPIDYKGELERAKKAIIGLKKENKELKKDPDKEKPRLDEEDINQRIEESIAERIKQEMEGFKVASTRSQAEIVVGQLTSNKDEQDLILHHYENSIRITGNLKNDLENAQALANKRKLTAQNAELKRAMSSKENISKPAGAGAKPNPPAKAPELNADTVKFLQSRGAKVNKDGKWQFPNGRIYEPEE